MDALGGRTFAVWAIRESMFRALFTWFVSRHKAMRARRAVT
jgi:hypothetical protein